MTNNNHLYSDFETKLDTLLGNVTATAGLPTYEHWRVLQMAKSEYDNIRIAKGIKFELDGFARWLEDLYGIQLVKVEGMIGQQFNIVDEQKYLVYKLKFQ